MENTSVVIPVEKIAEAIDTAAHALSKEPVYGLAGVTKFGNTKEVWNIDTELCRALGSQGQRRYAKDWGPGNEHRYYMAHRASQCEIYTSCLLDAVKDVVRCGGKVLVAGMPLQRMNAVMARYKDPRAADVVLTSDLNPGQETDLMSPVSRRHHVYARFVSSAGEVYIDLTHPQVGLDRARALARTSTPRWLSTGDRSLGGTMVQVCDILSEFPPCPDDDPLFPKDAIKRAVAKRIAAN